MFVVRDDARPSTYLVQSSVTTFQAYNNWGGRSLYAFNSPGARPQRSPSIAPMRPVRSQRLRPGQGQEISSRPILSLPALRFPQQGGNTIGFAGLSGKGMT